MTRQEKEDQANIELFKRLQEWGVDSFINYFGRLGHFESIEEGVSAIKDQMIPALQRYNKLEDVEWLKKELKKYIAG